MLGFYVRRSGFAILIVLVAVAILMLLYFVQIDAFFGPGLPSQPAGLEQHPWVLEDLLVPEGEDIKLPRSPKPDLDEAFSISAAVHRDDADRGTVTLSFDTNGRMTARWQCAYEQTGREYQIDTEMKGNISVKRTYEDAQGRDKKQLFFIAKGPYTKRPLGSDTAFGGEKGTCWLTGWLGPDRRVQGHVTITTDQQWAAAYAFDGP
ncbi:MAG: hypothetical protein OEV87_03350 [Phycisphaerae bacterium]|nr:hypothetical protein [Phycisphaerae bacterium]